VCNRYGYLAPITRLVTVQAAPLSCAGYEAGPDSAPYHDRQPVILDKGQWGAWLDLTGDPIPLLRPCPAGLILVARAVESSRI
jgi:putative SOS response-associated peptidase YedK